MQTPPHLRGRFSFSLFLGRQANADGVPGRCYFLAAGSCLLSQLLISVSALALS
jgi:hypothetical protein